MLSLALLGKDIQHSRSQSVYEKLLGQKIDYELIDCNKSSVIPGLDAIFAKHRGLSITTPYKQHFLKQVKLLGDVENLQAINCVAKSGREYLGFNTDYSALLELIPRMHEKMKRAKVMILGDGTMSHITQKALRHHHIGYECFTRKTYGDLTHMDFTKLSNSPLMVINACSRAFYYSGNLPNGSLYWNFNYAQPEQERLIKKPCLYIDGMEILELQAMHALHHWGLAR